MVPGPGEILAAVDAVTICASDAKMVRLGSDYPLFRGRDLARNPICLGHELALRVVASGPGNEDAYRPGVRAGVQPDLYNDGQRTCIGVNRPGGMADMVMLGADVLRTDHGSMLFPVDQKLSLAATALLEPLACVEGAFRHWGRSEILPSGRLVVLCADPSAGWLLDRPLPAGRVDLVGMSTATWHEAGGPLGDIRETSLDQVLADPRPIDDCIVLGGFSSKAIGTIYDRLSSSATFTWLAPSAVASGVPVDLAHYHYGKLTQRGAKSTRLSDAWRQLVRYDYRAGGRLLVYGASGAMGRMHLMRAIQATAGPSTIVALARGRAKLDTMLGELMPSARAHGRSLEAVATEGDDGGRADLVGVAPDGFDDVVVVAPGRAAMQAAILLLAPGGLLVGFAGTKAGEIVDLPLGRMVNDGVSITASSGSTVADQHRVIERTLAGELAPEALIAAVGGFAAMRDGIEAVLEGRFSGKVMIMPPLDWPLMTLSDLFDARPDLVTLAGPGRTWSKAIEDAVLAA